MKKIVIAFAIVLNLSVSFAQSGAIGGTVTDKGTGETLIGAAILYAEGKGTVTNVNGAYRLENIPYGTYTIKVTYVGFQPVERIVEINSAYRNLDFALTTATLREVEVVADIAIAKETPVAFTNITTLQIRQELGTNDLPMLLNTSPGVYVSPTGGSDGGARVSIRGFQDRNITVMIDGIPINNMDNGNVFWSSTFGMDIVLANMQVQRGMTSSRLAIPAIGGTINYITRSVENKPSFVVRQDYGSFNTLRTSVAYNSGALKNGWGISAAGSFRKSDGYSEQQFREEFFYFLKVQRQFGNHLVSFTGLGSPVKYGVRQDRQKIAVYDADYASSLFKGNDELYQRLSAFNVAQNIARETGDYSQRDMLAAQYGWGTTDAEGNFQVDPSVFSSLASENDFIDTAGVISKGFRYNNHWGYLNGDVKNERIREYHKPIFSLRDFWQVSPRIYLSNVLYYSSGRGGATSRTPSLGFGDYTDDLQIDFQDSYRVNTVGGVFGPPIFPNILPDELKSSVILSKRYDNHQWWGWLSTLDFKINETWSFAGGLDFRTYVSEQYLEIHDLIGGDYFIPSNEALPEDRPVTPPNNTFRQGDKYDYHNDNFMRWSAFFTELKYNKDSWKAFLNVSGVVTGYKRRDYFNSRDFISDGQRFPNAIGYGDVAFFNGTDLLVAAGAPNGAQASFFTSGDTTFVTNPSNTLNGFAPPGSSYIVNADQFGYDDPEAQVSETPWKNIPGFTVKTGVSYSIDEFNTVFTNLGYISRTPRFRNVVELGVFNQFLRDIENENIASIELGYAYSRNRFAVNVNAYYTDWQNRPINSGQTVFLPDRGISVRSNLNDMSALHKGAEVSFNYIVNKQISIDGFASLGDWRWTSAKSVNFFDDQGRPIYVVDANNRPTDSLVTIDFDADGVFVGDAPQTQIGGALQYKFNKNSFVKFRYTYFDRHYANFDPLQLQFEKKGRQSWKMPGYGTFSIFAGYTFDLNWGQLELLGSIDNLFDVRYLSDGNNNDGPALVTTNYLNNPPQATVAFDANSTSVYFGLPRVFSLSLKLNM